MVKDIGFDKTLMAVTVILIVLGLLMIYSTTMIMAKENFGDSYYFLKKRLLWLSVGLLVFLILLFLKYPVYLNQKFIIMAMGLTIIGLLMVFFSGKINNAYRWIRVGGVSVQPSEFAKIVVVLYLSYVFSRRDFDVNRLKNLLIVLLPVLVMEGLILREPDFGNFLLILMITGSMLFIAGFKIWYFGVFFTCLIPLIYLLIKMDPERINRITGFLNPEAYSTTYGFQTLQSIYAVGSGGLFGKGVGNSMQKLFFLPYAYTDFIFAIIAEELGLIGTFMVITLFVGYFLRGIRIAVRTDHRQAYFLVMGLTILLVSQAMINISVTIGIFPAKGLPLPFVSSGGTSLMASLIITGIILNISRHRKVVFIND